MSIIAFIALVASFSLKNLPISEKTFVPLLLGIGLLYFLLVPQSYKKSVTYGNPCALFYTLSILYFELAELEFFNFGEFLKARIKQTLLSYMSFVFFYSISDYFKLMYLDFWHESRFLAVLACETNDIYLFYHPVLP